MVVVLHYKEKVALNYIGKKTVINQKSLTLELFTALLILTSGPLFLIVEYCSHGNLKDFLRNNRPSLLELSGDMEVSLTFRDLLSFAYQITKGMSYLSSKKVIE